jgi:hypothetical protein
VPVDWQPGGHDMADGTKRTARRQCGIVAVLAAVEFIVLVSEPAAPATAPHRLWQLVANGSLHGYPFASAELHDVPFDRRPGQSDEPQFDAVLDLLARQR